MDNFVDNLWIIFLFCEKPLFSAYLQLVDIVDKVIHKLWITSFLLWITCGLIVDNFLCIFIVPKLSTTYPQSYPQFPQLFYCYKNCQHFKKSLQNLSICCKIIGTLAVPTGNPKGLQHVLGRLFCT